MQQFLTYTVIGITTAAIYAVAASGLVVTYTTSGIFNFAHGAFGMLGAFAYWQLRVDWGWPAPFALAAVLLVAAPLLGFGTERLIMRNLQGVSEVVRISVTVSLLLALMGLAQWIWPQDVNRSAAEFFAGHKFKVPGVDVNVTYHQLIALLVAIAVAIGLHALLYRTRSGVAMRAAVDDRPLARLNGSRPDRAAMLAWAIGAALAAVSGVLNAPYQSLSITLLTLLVVNAFAAAIVGRLRSLPMTFLGALILGLAEAYSIGYLGQSDVTVSGHAIWNVVARFFVSNKEGFRNSMPAILLFAVLLLLPQAKLRGHGVQRSREATRLPSLHTAVLGGAILVTFVFGVAPMLTNADRVYLAQGLGLAIVVLSLVLLTGLAGQVSLAQMSFAGLGAVAMGKWGGLVTAHRWNASSMIVGIALAALLAGAVGALVALPALRLHGIYLALATGAFALITSNLVFNQPGLFPNSSLTVPRLHLPGVSLEGDKAYTVMLAIAFSAAGIGVVALRRSRFGRRLQAMKDSPIACATLGLDLTRTKLTVFALSSAIAGVGGALLAGISRVASSADFDFLRSLPLAMIAVVGGVGAVGGALIGGTLLASFDVIRNIFGANAIGVFRFGEARMLDVVKPLPGLMGVSLGRNPNGIAAQIGTGYRAVGASKPATALAIAGGAALMVLARSGAIAHWSFFIALVLWTVSIVPSLPALLAKPPMARRGTVGVLLGLVVGVGAFGNWASWIASNGWRVVFLVALSAATVVVVQRVLDPKAPNDETTSTDWHGAIGRLTAGDAEMATVGLGLDEEVLTRAGTRS